MIMWSRSALTHSTEERVIIRRWRRAWLVIPVVLAVLVAACSGGSEEKSAPVDAKDVDTMGLRFTNVTTEAGLNAPQSPEPFYGEDSMTSGAAVADLDGDGFDDVFLTRAGLPNVLYLNNGDGTFRDATIESGLAEAEPTYGSSAAAFFDTDGDGALDLFTTGFGRGPNRLYMNDGNGLFTEETIERGVTFPPMPEEATVSQMHGVSVGDVNGDGALDLLVLHWYTEGLSGYAEGAYALAAERGIDDPTTIGACEVSALMDEVERDGVTSTGPGSRSRLFINDGDGNFTDSTQEWGLSLDRTIAFTGVFIDYDGDGYQDLAITGDGCSSRLFHNVDGERFEDVSDTAFPGTDENAMGAVFTDINGDGRPDWVISSISYGEPGEHCPVGGSLVGCSGNRVYVNNGDGTFDDATTQLGLRDGGWGWGLAVEDFTNTGDQSVVMTNGYLERSGAGMDAVAPSEEANPYRTFITPFRDDRTRFWMRHDTGPFVDVAERVGITDTGLGHGLIPFDYDNDGDLDLLIANSYDPPILYRNDSPTDRSWLTIRLDDPTTSGNRHGEGARVEVFTGDEEPRVGWITSNGSYESQKPAQFHLGFGDRRDAIERVDVYWPGSSEPQQVTDVAVDQRLVIERS